LYRRLKRGLKNGLYALVTCSLAVVVKIFFRCRVVGRENVRRDGSYIAVARHRSYWDIPFMAVALGTRNPVHFIARRGLMKSNPIVRLAIRAYATIIDRESFTKADFRRMLEAVRRERVVGLFPEGTTKRRVDAKAGAVHFASLANKEFLPVNIKPRGPYPPKYPIRFPRVTVSIGAPFGVSDLDGGGPPEEARSERYRRMSLRLMERVDTA
jgi:1-acyl-sn-glycerol-3-phosphate acyltransferase